MPPRSDSDDPVRKREGIGILSEMIFTVRLDTRPSMYPPSSMLPKGSLLAGWLGWPPGKGKNMVMLTPGREVDGRPGLTVAQLSSLEELVVDLKDRALLWIYIAEWMTVVSTLRINGAALWSLVIRRRIPQGGTDNLAI